MCAVCRIFRRRLFLHPRWMRHPRVPFRLPLRLSLVLPLTLVSAFLSDGAVYAQSGSVSLRDLSRRWSGSSTPPSCTANVQQQRDGVPRLLTTDDCVWPARQRGHGVSRVTGIRSLFGVLQLVTLSEDVHDRAAASRTRDSLSSALRSQGFAEYLMLRRRPVMAVERWRSPLLCRRCISGWTAARGVFATTDVKHIPDIACPDASSKRLR